MEGPARRGNFADPGLVRIDSGHENLGRRIVAFVGVCVLAVGGAGVYVFFQHVDIDDASAADADRSFDEARARFAGQTPLLSLADHEWSVNRRPSTADAKPRTLRVMAWETSDERLVNLSIPFWLLRLGDEDAVDLNFNDLDDEAALRDLDLTVADLDRHGPGLIIDYDAPRDGRVLVWAE